MVAPTTGGIFQVWQDTDSNAVSGCSSNTAQRIEWEGLHTSWFNITVTGYYTFTASETFQGWGKVYATCPLGVASYEAWMHISVYAALWDNYAGATIVPNTYNTYTIDTSGQTCVGGSYQQVSFNWDSSPVTRTVSVSNVHLFAGHSYAPRAALQVETDTQANYWGYGGGAEAQLWFDNPSNPTEKVTLNSVSIT